MAHQFGSSQLSVNLESVDATHWGLEVRVDDQRVDIVFDTGPEHFDPDIGLDATVVDAVCEQLAARSRGLEAPTNDPILRRIAEHLNVGEWISGKRLRHDLNISIEKFQRAVSKLLPRYLRRTSDDDDTLEPDNSRTDCRRKHVPFPSRSRSYLPVNCRSRGRRSGCRQFRGVGSYSAWRRTAAANSCEEHCPYRVLSRYPR